MQIINTATLWCVYIIHGKSMCTIFRKKQNVDHDYTQKPYLSRFHHFFDLGLVFLILYNKSVPGNHKHHKYKDSFSNGLIKTDLPCSSYAHSTPFSFKQVNVYMILMELWTFAFCNIMDSSYVLIEGDFGPLVTSQFPYLKKALVTARFLI